MPVIDARPQGVDLRAYAGDTFSFALTVDADYSDYVWSGQIRSDHTDMDYDTEFAFGDVVAIDEDKWQVQVTLSANQTQALADLVIETGVVAQVLTVGSVKSTKTSFQTYSGVWDIQVQLNDVVKTLVQGTIRIDSDVTRV